MKFVKGSEAAAVKDIVQTISIELAAKKRVLWLVSGGSNASAESKVMAELSKETQQLNYLAVLPMDERYGPHDHEASNTGALKKAGFDTDFANYIDVLKHNVSFELTVDFYGEVAAAAISNADTIIGQFGLGADGHTAGILPNSPATEENTAVAAGYGWTDYDRLTLTPLALQRTHIAFVLAYGQAKHTALDSLVRNDELFDAMPAKLLYQIPDVRVYNDHIESGE